MEERKKVGRKPKVDRNRLTYATAVQNRDCNIDNLTNPAGERNRLGLNARERFIILTRQAVSEFVEKSLSIPEAIDSQGDDFKGMSTTEFLNIVKENDLIGPIHERISRMFLDLDKTVTIEEIAGELGLSRTQLKRLVESPEFQDNYNKFFYNIVQDPRIKAVQESFADLIVPTFHVYQRILTDESVPWTIKLKAAQDIRQLHGIETQKVNQQSRSELAKFLSDNNIETQNVQIIQNQNVFTNIPDDYMKALEAYNPDIVSENVL